VRRLLWHRFDVEALRGVLLVVDLQAPCVSLTAGHWSDADLLDAIAARALSSTPSADIC
jgi:hypothetical protein